MAIPQYLVRVQLDSAAIDSLYDSSGHDSLELLQIVDAAKSIYRFQLENQNYTDYNYYDSAGSLPSYIDDSDGYLTAVDSSLEGLLVTTSNLTENNNSLWLHTGKRWRELVNLDSDIPDTVTQGQEFAYISAGKNFTGTKLNTTERWPFASEGIGSNVGTLTQSFDDASGTNSPSFSYLAGGSTTSATRTRIEKFSQANEAQSKTIADLFKATRGASAQYSEFFGYHTAGKPIFDVGPETAERPVIQKYSFINDEDASFVQEITPNRSTDRAGISSKIYGYAAGGQGIPYESISNEIIKFNFSNDIEAVQTGVGSLTLSGDGASGISSTTKGYVTSRRRYSGNSPFMLNLIDEFPFAAETNVTDIGDQFIARINAAGHSYQDSFGYVSGGTNLGAAAIIIVDKFPFSAPFIQTLQVGDLTTAKVGITGTQK